MSIVTDHDRIDSPSGAHKSVRAALVTLWVYAIAAGLIALGVGRLALSVLGDVVPQTPLRIGSRIAVVILAGLAYPAVLSWLQRRRS